MAIGVFGLKKIYKRQVDNIDNKSFVAWSESAKYGYFAHSTPEGNYCGINRLDFSNETTSSKYVPMYRYNTATVSNISYGYFAGGFTPPDVFGFDSTITRLDFSNETVSDPGKNLPKGRQGALGVSNNSYGYFGGGQDIYPNPPTIISTITRLDFSNETVSDPGKILPTVRYYGTSVSNNSYGYFAGGYGPGNLSNIVRLDFSNETVSDPGKNFAPVKGKTSGVSNNSYGYFAGGEGAAPPYYLSTITRLDFSNETLSDPGKNLSLERYGAAGVSNNSYGYFGGGDRQISSYLSLISRLDFSNETLSNLGNYIPTSRVYSSVSGGASVLRPNKTFGYFVGGSSPVSPFTISTITRLDFSIETVSNPGNNLPTTERSGVAGVSNNSYGYFGGGIVPGSTRISTITRLDFSNETVSNPGKNFVGARNVAAGVFNNSYGYFGGGATPPSSPELISTITRLDFSNETVSDPGKNLNPARFGAAGVFNNSYGYFGGGVGPGLFYISTITRLDFSNETVSDPTKNLPTARAYAAGASNNSYAYFGGGYFTSPETYFNIITKLDFSNETVNNLVNNLPTTRYGAAGVSNNSYGYFGGGLNPNAAVTNLITRLDFSNETVGNLVNNLPTARSISAGVTNSN